MYISHVATNGTYNDYCIPIKTSVQNCAPLLFKIFSKGQRRPTNEPPSEERKDDRMSAANHLCPMEDDEKKLKHLPLWSRHWRESKSLCVYFRIDGRSTSLETLSKRKKILAGKSWNQWAQFGWQRRGCKVKLWSLLVSQTSVSASLLILENQNQAQAEEGLTTDLGKGLKLRPYTLLISEWNFCLESQPWLMCLLFSNFSAKITKTPKRTFILSVATLAETAFLSSQREPNRRGQEMSVRQEGQYMEVWCGCRVFCVPAWPAQSLWPNIVLLLKPLLFQQVCCYAAWEQIGGDGRDEK